MNEYTLLVDFTKLLSLRSHPHSLSNREVYPSEHVKADMNENIDVFKIWLYLLEKVLLAYSPNFEHFLLSLRLGAM